jgi:hypothetical protein
MKSNELGGSNQRFYEAYVVTNNWHHSSKYGMSERTFYEHQTSNTPRVLPSLGSRNTLTKELRPKAHCQLAK